jgi:hypothetical protein
MINRVGIFLLFFLVQGYAYGFADFGVGLSSSMSGRKIPSLNAGFEINNWQVNGGITGARSAYYYHSNYSVSVMKNWDSGVFVRGKLRSGVGVGLFYTEIAFQDEGASSEETSNDFGFGPAFKVRWYALDPFFVNLELIFGIRDVYRNLTMNGQDLVSFSMGVEI